MPWVDLQSDIVAFPCHTFFAYGAHLFLCMCTCAYQEFFVKGGGGPVINVLITLFKNITNLILEDLLRVFT